MRWPWTKDKRRRRHSCKWSSLAIQHNRTAFGGGMWGPQTEPMDATVVLQRSCCGEVRTATLPGRWTLDEINGEIPTADAVVQKFMESSGA